MRTYVAISLVAFVLLLIGCGPDPWTEVKPSDGMFVVLMPGQPTEKQIDPDLPLGRPKLVQYMLTRNGITFCLDYADYPDTLTSDMSPDAVLDSGLDRLFSAYPHEPKRSERTTLQGFLGRSFIIEGAGTTVIGRSYWVGQRLYILQAIMASRLSDRREAYRFFRSFRFEPSHGPTKPVQATAAALCSFYGLGAVLLLGSVLAQVPAAVPDRIR